MGLKRKIWTFERYEELTKNRKRVPSVKQSRTDLAPKKRDKTLIPGRPASESAWRQQSSVRFLGTFYREAGSLYVSFSPLSSASP